MVAPPLEVVFHKTDAMTNDDALWFAARAHRAYRLRAILPSDNRPAGLVDAVLVHQVAPGVRVRIALIDCGALALMPELDDDAQERLLDELFDLALEHQKHGAPAQSEFVDLATLVERRLLRSERGRLS